jgi:hypothetical protein
MSNDNNITDSDFTGIPKIRTKVVWEDGRQIRKPDLSSTFSTTSTNNIREFKYQKTLNETISHVDKKRFKELPNDDEKYQMISNMVTGEDSNKPYQLFPSRFVKGEFRTLIQILEDLIDKHKIYFDSNSGNLFTFDHAIKERMISFPCRNCSKVLFSENERSNHSLSHMDQSSS